MFVTVLSLCVFLCIPTLPMLHSLTLPNSVSIHPGVVLERRADAVFINAYLDIYIDLRCSAHLYEQLVDIENKTNTLRNTVTNFSYTYHKQFESNQEQMVLAVQFMDANLQTFDLKFNSFVKTYHHLMKSPWVVNHRVYNARRKRAWIEAGGSILQAIFGTALDGDVTKLSRKVQLLEHHQLGVSQVLHSLKTQLRANLDNLVSFNKQLDEMLTRQSGYLGQARILTELTWAASYNPPPPSLPYTTPLHSFLSPTNSLPSPVIPLLSNASLTPSIHLLFGLPLPLFPSTDPTITLPARLSSPPLITCPYHFNTFCSHLLTKSLSHPHLSLILSFLTLSLIVNPHTLLNPFISNTSKSYFSFAFKHHVSLPYKTFGTTILSNTLLFIPSDIPPLFHTSLTHPNALFPSFNLCPNSCLPSPSALITTPR